MQKKAKASAAARSSATGTSGRLRIALPTAAEERAIRRGIAADKDTYVPSDAEFARMKPARG